MISDTDLFVNRFISVPKDMGQLNCAAFVAGIVRGALDRSRISCKASCACSTCSYNPAVPPLRSMAVCRVTAHFVAVKDARPKNDNTHEVRQCCLSQRAALRANRLTQR